ncbi:MAG: hypothetical protein HC822_21290 [Oscillochloris sp.]|nr:hypothetical protein [Oscillochloris sp.]
MRFGAGIGHIDRLRWSPDSSAIAFTAGTRPNDQYRFQLVLAAKLPTPTESNIVIRIAKSRPIPVN